MDEFNHRLDEAIRQVLALAHDAPIIDIARAHCDLATIVRRRAEEVSSYAESLVDLEFPHESRQPDFIGENSPLAKLIVVQRWGAAFRDRESEGLDRILETALGELTWAMQLGSPDGLLTHTVVTLLDERRRENAHRWPSANGGAAPAWAEALWAASTFSLPSSSHDLQLGWADVGTEFTNWRFSEHADPAYWEPRNNLLLNALGSFQDDFIHDHFHSLLDGLPRHFGSEHDFLSPIDFIRRGGRISDYLEIPVGPPSPDEFPVDTPRSANETHRYRAQLIRWIDEFVSSAVKKQSRFEWFEVRSTSLRQLHTLGLPRISPTLPTATDQLSERHQ